MNKSSNLMKLKFPPPTTGWLGVLGGGVGVGQHILFCCRKYHSQFIARVSEVFSCFGMPVMSGMVDSSANSSSCHPICISNKLEINVQPSGVCVVLVQLLVLAWCYYLVVWQYAYCIEYISICLSSPHRKVEHEQTTTNGQFYY